MAIISKTKRKSMGNTWDRLRKSDYQVTRGIGRFERFDSELYLKVVNRKGGFIKPVGYKEQFAAKRKLELESTK